MTVKICFVLEKEGSASEEVEVHAEQGELVTQAAFRAGVTIQQTCGGSPSCADCKIKVLESEGDAFEEMEFEEEQLLGNVYFITKERLACQAKIANSSKIWVPDPKPIHNARRSQKSKGSK